jgi:hypothetical protein
MMQISTIQKRISGFKPELHWKIILVSTFVLVVVSCAYASYLYMYAQKQVSMDVSSDTVTGTTIITDDTAVGTSSNVSFTSAEQMNELFVTYRNRNTVYQNIIQTLASKKTIEVVVSTTTASTTTGAAISTTTIATSSKQ